VTVTSEQSTTKIQSRNFSRLSWQCRRGLLELDLLLQGFMERCYNNLSDSDKASFETLLKSPDQLLLDYLLGGTVPFDKDVANVVKQIRLAAQSSG